MSEVSLYGVAQQDGICTSNCVKWQLKIRGPPVIPGVDMTEAMSLTWYKSRSTLAPGEVRHYQVRKSTYPVEGWCLVKEQNQIISHFQLLSSMKLFFNFEAGVFLNINQKYYFAQI